MPAEWSGEKEAIGYSICPAPPEGVGRVVNSSAFRLVTCSISVTRKFQLSKIDYERLSMIKLD
jgi:hypothetical protein